MKIGLIHVGQVVNLRPIGNRPPRMASNLQDRPQCVLNGEQHGGYVEQASAGRGVATQHAQHIGQFAEVPQCVT
jgi:hypothetical protein